MGKFKDYEEVLKLRYTHLYGNADHSLRLKREKKKLIFMIVCSSVLLLIAVCNDLYTARGEYSNVKFDKNGKIISVKRPQHDEESYSFTTKAIVISDDIRFEKEYYITIEPAGEQKNANGEVLFTESEEKNTAEEELKRLISALNENTLSSEVRLPQELENGDQIIWAKTDNTDYVIYILLFFVIMWLIYHNRFHTIDQEEKRARESIIKELPEFINKLVLLLHAGVILNTAFLKISDDCDDKKIGSSYFYKRITDIGELVRETNASFYNEMYIFAKYSGVKELMRVTNIMMDNVNKGDDLSDKLRRENELLWFARKQQAEEKGKLAETKLTLPLMILLTVLIIVTIAPALMEI